jgi:hypothetical protein
MNMHTTIAANSINDRREWEEALASYRAAKAAEEHYYDTVYVSTEEEMGRRVDKPILVLSTTLPDGTVVRQFPKPADLDWYASIPGYAPQAIPLRKAWDRYLQARQQVESELGFDAIRARENKLFNAMLDAIDRLMKIPSPDLQAFSMKVIFADNNDDRSDWSELVVEEARQFSTL